MDGNYELVLERVSRQSGVSEEELERRVEAKRSKLSGLISKEGALQVIAAELGISFDNEKLKIKELLPGMRKVNTVGKVITIYPIRTYKTKSGDEGKVANMIIADDTSNVKVVLWDTNHIDLIEKGEVGEKTVIEIISGSMRDGEIHMGSFSELKKSSDILNNVVTEKTVKEKPLSEILFGESIKVRAFVVQSFLPRFFEVNPDTGKKLTDEERATGKIAEKRALINVVIDDGTENIRAVLFHENLKKLGFETIEDNPTLMEQQRENILGKEMVFVGNVRRNSYFGNNELVIEDVQEIDLDKLIAQLEG
ncbi:MAG: hypothetical protein KC516_00455 [Nanoarchaeota archaeon]|nr:hypothetical protein [Nanoarchaeota archaeon]